MIWTVSGTSNGLTRPGRCWWVGTTTNTSPQVIQPIASLKTAGKTVVVVSHKRGLVTRADKVLVMADGAIQACGERDEVMARLGRPRIVAGTEAAAS